MDEHDPVNHPAHYTAGAVECIDAIEAAMTADEFVGFLRGQMIKYVWRLGRKGDGLEDVEKALWYGRRLAAKLEGMQVAVDEEVGPETWLSLGDMVTSAQRAEARDLAAMSAVLDANDVPTEGRLGTGAFSSQSINAAALAEYRDRAAIAAKERELLKLSHLEDTDGNVVLMYSDHVNWDEAPEWANFLAYDDVHEGGENECRAYWFENRPEYRPASRYWASGGQGGRIQYAQPYAGQGGNPRLFARATG